LKRGKVTLSFDNGGQAPFLLEDLHLSEQLDPEDGKPSSDMEKTRKKPKLYAAHIMCGVVYEMRKANSLEA